MTKFVSYNVNMPGIDWVEETADMRGRPLLQTAVEHDLSQLVSFPTHVKGNILNLVITNNPERVLDITDVGRLGRSDHCMLEIMVESNVSNSAEQDWNRADMKKMREELDTLNWRSELNSERVNEAWEKFREILTGPVERNVPEKNMEENRDSCR
jgi:hypothetical protein